MGFHQKDDLEAWGIAQVKAGNLAPKDFDTRIWSGSGIICKSVHRTPTHPIEIAPRTARSPPLEGVTPMLADSPPTTSRSSYLSFLNWQPQLPVKGRALDCFAWPAAELVDMLSHSEANRITSQFINFDL
jgi:hypothetical protein